jgi:hypothetical protein
MAHYYYGFTMVHDLLANDLASDFSSYEYGLDSYITTVAHYFGSSGLENLGCV